MKIGKLIVHKQTGLDNDVTSVEISETRGKTESKRS